MRPAPRDRSGHGPGRSTGARRGWPAPEARCRVVVRRPRCGGAVVARPVLRGPLPHVAGDVDEAVAVRGEAADRRGACVAVEQVVVEREVALPGVGHHATARGGVLSPGVGGAPEPTAGRQLPLRLGRQRLAGPRGVGEGVDVRDVGDRVAVEAVQAAARALGVAPLGARHPGPPGPVVVEADPPGRWREHQRPRDQLVGGGVREGGGVRRRLRHGRVPGGPDEPTELRHRHRVLVHPEPVGPRLVDRALLGVELLGAHEERAARDPHHVLRRTSGRVRG